MPHEERWPAAHEALYEQVQGLVVDVGDVRALRAEVTRLTVVLAGLEAVEKAQAERWAKFKGAAKGVGLALTPAAVGGAISHQQVLEAIRNLLRAWLEAS